MVPTPPKRRSWLRIGLIGCGGLVAVVLVCAVIGAIANRNKPATTAASAATATLPIVTPAAAAIAAAEPTVAPTEAAAVPTDVPPTAAPTDVPTPEATAAPTAMPAVGVDVKVGDVRWKILEAKDQGDTLKSDNQFVKPKATSGKWVEVRLEIENQSIDQLSFSGASIDLKDDKGRTFKTSNDALMYIPQEEQCAFAQLSANVPKTCRVYYEVPKDAAGLKAVVGDLKAFGAPDQEIGLGF